VTVQVLAAFEGLLAQVIALTLFIPLLIGMGGNSGTQASTTIVRAMAVGEVRVTDFGRVILREGRAGALLGTMLAGIALLPLLAVFGPQVAVIVCVSLLTIVTFATAFGALLPFAAGRLGIDPALVSGPLVTSAVDAIGLLIYLLIATAVLGL
jgi:magnesium transporter